MPPTPERRISYLPLVRLAKRYGLGRRQRRQLEQAAEDIARERSMTLDEAAEALRRKKPK